MSIQTTIASPSYPTTRLTEKAQYIQPAADVRQASPRWAIMSHNMGPTPLHFLLLTLAGWINRHQQNAIEYLMEENRVLREHLGPSGYASPTGSVGDSRSRERSSVERRSNKCARWRRQTPSCAGIDG